MIITHIPDKDHDKEWEQEKSLWEAEQKGEPDFTEVVSLEAFKKLADEYFTEKEEQVKTKLEEKP